MRWALFVTLLCTLAIEASSFWGWHRATHSGCHWWRCTHDSRHDKEEVTPSPKEALCSSDSDCTNGYCDRYVKRCLTCKGRNSLCRRDENCCSGRVCEWGRCQDLKKTGSEGSRCKRDGDCNSGLCCAKDSGRFICKRLGRLGEGCYEPEGGYGYSQHHVCPCAQGLQCKTYKSYDHGFFWHRHVYREHRECVARPKTTSQPATDPPTTEGPFSSDKVTSIAPTRDEIEIDDSVFITDPPEPRQDQLHQGN